MSEEETNFAGMLGFVSASTYRKKIVTLLLDNTPRTVTQISEGVEMYMSHVSKAIKELEGMGLVECLNPDRRKGKLFVLTGKGKRTSSRLSISKGLSGLELKVAKTLDEVSVTYARNLKLGLKAHKAAADFVILDDLEPEAVVVVESLSDDSLKNLKESAFPVENWREGRKSLKTVLILGGLPKEKAVEAAGFLVEGNSFDAVLHEDDLECIRRLHLGLEGLLEVGKRCVDWSAGETGEEK